MEKIYKPNKIKMKKILISTHPFSINNKNPLLLLKKNKIQYHLNLKGRKLKKEELIKIIPQFDGLICGTDIIDSEILDKAENLEIISRVGTGFNNLDLKTIKKKNIKVTYTPGVPSATVAEFTIYLMINMLRKAYLSNNGIKINKWSKYLGKNLSEANIGIVGFGHIGLKLVKLLKAFNCKNIFINDIKLDKKIVKKYSLNISSKQYIYRNCNLITFHVPLTKKTNNLVTKRELQMMSSDTILINTSRGEIFNENDLYYFLKNKRIQGAAIDVFSKEPYSGPLINLENCFCTSHIASMTKDCRNKMEELATLEVVRYFNNLKLKNEINY
jgi:D-3-phosphoglycerate dehydrogenase